MDTQPFGMVGSSAKMRSLNETLRRVAADRDVTVLITGESGTGKELVARALHDHSPRKDCSFVAINCAAIPEELLESELFGYTKGAFTGAASGRTGKFQFADGGTMFLDEIGDMKLGLQSKLLRVMQEREFTPVGGNNVVSVNVRIVAATHQNIWERVLKGSFREDLYYRLNVIPIEVPSLRERLEDVPALVIHFVNKFKEVKNGDFGGFSESALDKMQSYTWPGNVRELENFVHRMVVLGGEKVIMPDDISFNEMVCPLSRNSAQEREKVLFSNDVDNLSIEERGALATFLASSGNPEIFTRRVADNLDSALNKMAKLTVNDDLI